MTTLVVTLCILGAIIALMGWGIIIGEVVTGKFQTPETVLRNSKSSLHEWRIPIINRYIKAEYLMGMLVFTIIDRNSDQADEIGFWENGEWCFIQKVTAGELDDRGTEFCRRIMMIIMKRYPARISRLQKLVNHKNKIIT